MSGAPAAVLSLSTTFKAGAQSDVLLYLLMGDHRHMVSPDCRFTRLDASHGYLERYILDESNLVEYSHVLSVQRSRCDDDSQHAGGCSDNESRNEGVL